MSKYSCKLLRYCCTDVSGETEGKKGGKKSIFSEQFLREKLNYIHGNPVRAGLVENPTRYPYSSCRNYELDDQTLIEIDKDWF